MLLSRPALLLLALLISVSAFLLQQYWAYIPASSLSPALNILQAAAKDPAGAMLPCFEGAGRVARAVPAIIVRLWASLGIVLLRQPWHLPELSLPTSLDRFLWGGGGVAEVRGM